MSRVFVVLFLVGVVGCGGPMGSDAGFEVDAGGLDASGGSGGGDAGGLDAGPDAGGSDAAVDAGQADAGSSDAGFTDGGEKDGGDVDAGGMDAGGMDAGGMDAGGMDAGPMDAGVVDAGQPDAGSDAGSPPDAGVDDGGIDGGFDAGCDGIPGFCGANHYCASGFCVPGCDGPNGCRSGVCTSQHDCVNCTSNAECAAGRVCGTGVCAPRCAGSCDAGWLCCGDVCVDPQRDPRHCGGCPSTCGADEFCGRGSCFASVLANVCQQPTARVLFDDITEDDDAGLSIGEALVSSCSVGLQSAGQVDAGMLDILTGEPLQFGELLVAGGGSFGQRSIGWLDQSTFAPVHDTSTLTTYTLTRPDASVIVSGPATDLSPSHDVLVVQLVRTPYGAVVLNAGGFYGPGTTAAGWYLVNQLLPVRATLSTGWYVVDWVDSNLNQVPDSADTWTVIASGP